MSQNGQEVSFAGRYGNVHVHSTYGKIEGKAGRREGGGRSAFYFFLQNFIIFNFPLTQASLESANSAGVNGNESGASRHALAAVSMVHLLVHAKSPSRAAGAVGGQCFSEAAGVPSFVWRDYMVGDLVLGGFILCFMPDGWAMFGWK